MKTFAIICTVLLALWMQLAAQTFPTYAWNYPVGGATLDETQDIAVDDSGYVYATGQFSSTVDFDPGPGASGFTMGMGQYGFFFVKLDAMGNFLWVRTLPGTGSEGNAIALDDSNNVFLAGSFTGTTDFDWGPGVFSMTASSPGNAFLMKVDRNGGFKWAKQFIGIGTEEVMGLVTARDGSVAMSGAFNYTVDFDPGAATYSLTSAGGYDGYLLKLDRNGNFLWAGQFGNAGAWDEAPALASDASGNLYGTALTYGSVDMDMGPGVSNLPASSNMVGAVYKLDASMNLVWVKPLQAATSTLYLESIALDPWGNIGVAGNFKQSMDLDPGPGVYTIYSGSTNGTDDFLVKFDSSGQFVWGFALWGIGGYGSTQDLACDNQGAFYMLGYFHAGHDFDPSPAVYYMNTTTADLNLYVAKYNSAGSIDWAAWVGGTSGANQGHALVVDSHRSVYMGAKMVYPADMDPGPGSIVQSCGMQGDIAVSKWSVCPPQSATIATTACDSAQVNGQFYTQTGTYTQTLQSVQGCDSILTIQVTISRTDSTLNATACDAITVNSQTYNATGTYTQHLTNSHNCDSTLTLNLEILQSSASTLTVDTCEAYTLNGQTYSTSGTYNQVLVNAAGCDSSLALILNIQPLAATISQSGNELTAMPGGETYQWLDCGQQMAPIPGATGPTFPLTSSGTFAVIVAHGTCADTSDCLVALSTNPGKATRILPVPNPNQGQFTLDLRSILGDPIELQVCDALGRTIFRKSLEAATLQSIDLGSVPPGLYQAALRQAQWQAGFNVVVE